MVVSLLSPLTLPDKPGQLVAVSQMLAEADANVIKLDHNQFKTLTVSMKWELQSNSRNKW